MYTGLVDYSNSAFLVRTPMPHWSQNITQSATAIIQKAAHTYQKCVCWHTCSRCGGKHPALWCTTDEQQACSSSAKLWACLAAWWSLQDWLIYLYPIEYVLQFIWYFSYVILCYSQNYSLKEKEIILKEMATEFHSLWRSTHCCCCSQGGTYF